MSWVSNLRAIRREALYGKSVGELPELDASKPDFALAVAAHIVDGLPKRKIPPVENITNRLDTARTPPPGLDGEQQREFGVEFDRFQVALARVTAQIPARKKMAHFNTAIAGLAELLTEVQPPQVAPAAVSAYARLLFSRPGADAASAKAAVLELVSAFSDRQGVASALGLLAALNQELVGAQPYSAKKMPALWQKLVKYLAQAAPQDGLDLESTGRVFRALSGKEGRVDGVIKQALEELRQGSAEARVDLQARLESSPGGPHPSAEGKAGYQQFAQSVARLLERDPMASPALFDRVELLREQLDTELRTAPQSGQQKVARYVAILNSLPSGAGVEPVFAALNALHPRLLAVPAGQPNYNFDAQFAQDPVAALFELATAHLPAGTVDFGGLLTEVRALPPLVQMRVLAAFASALGNDAYEGKSLLQDLVSFAQTTDDVGALIEHGAAFTEILGLLPVQISEEDAASLAAHLARETARPANPERLGEFCATIRGLFSDDKLNLASIVDGRSGGAGLLDILGPVGMEHFRSDPLPLLQRLLQGLAAAPQSSERATTSLVRHAIGLARELALMDEPPELTQARATEDWQYALTNPEAFRIAAAGEGGDAYAVRASQQRTTVALCQAHPELPPELAFTAMRFMDEQQLGWLCERFGKERSLDNLRALRSTVLLAVKNGRMDLVDAVRNTSLKGTPLSGILGLVAAEYRLNRAEQHEIDKLVAALGEGRDLVAEMAAENAAALADLNSKAPAASEEGKAAIARVSPLVEKMLAWVTPGKELHGMDSQVFSQALTDFIEATNAGTVAELKYTGPLADSLLGELSAEQRAIWQAPFVLRDGVLEMGADGAQPTGSAKPTQPAVPTLSDYDIGDSLQLLQGLGIALQKETILNVPELPSLRWDNASLASLAPRIEELRETVANIDKNDPHRVAVARLYDQARNTSAVIAAKLAIEEKLPDGTGTPDLPDLVWLRDLMQGVRGAAKWLAAPGCADAAAEVAHLLAALPQAGELRAAMQKAEQPPDEADAGARGHNINREGVYASDEDGIDAWFDAYRGGSCLSPAGQTGGSTQNQASLVEYLVAPNYRLGRVVAGYDTVARGVFRLHRATIGNYTGPVLYVDSAFTPEGSQAEVDKKRQLHAIGAHKAAAMGIPFAANIDISDVARAVGLQSADQQSVTYHVAAGRTGVHHNQGLGTYMIQWTAAEMAADPQPKNEPAQTPQQRANHYVALPPGMAI